MIAYIQEVCKKRVAFANEVVSVCPTRGRLRRFSDWGTFYFFFFLPPLLCGRMGADFPFGPTIESFSVYIVGPIIVGKRGIVLPRVIKADAVCLFLRFYF